MKLIPSIIADNGFFLCKFGYILQFLTFEIAKRNALENKKMRHFESFS
jgi:hypothetical protein